MEAASDYPFLDYPRTAPHVNIPQFKVVTINCHRCALYPALAFVIVTIPRWGYEGCEEKQPQRKKKSAARTTAAGPTTWRCRHAEFLPYPANNAAPVTELDSQLKKLQFALPASSHSHNLLPLLTIPCPTATKCVRAPKLKDIKIACDVLRACPGHAPSTANFRRQVPSRVPSSFPFQIEPLRAIPPLVHTLTEHDFDAPAVDMF